MTTTLEASEGRHWRCLPREEKGQQLIPGLPDAVTLTCISPKFSWRGLYALAAVSRGWYFVVRSRKVYNDRVRYNSTETAVLVNWTPPSVTENVHSNAVGLYSPRDNSLCYLPPIPNVSGGIPIHCQCVSLDGKVYVLGGGWNGSTKVYVLDLAGQVTWEERAEVKYTRKYVGFSELGCGVMDRKVHTFSTLEFSEVYDTLMNTWSVINYSQAVRNLVDDDPFGAYFAHVSLMEMEFRFESAGNELCGVYEDPFQYIPYAKQDCTEEELTRQEVPPFLFYNPAKGNYRIEDFYNPVTGNYRKEYSFWKPESAYFTAQGRKLHAMSRKRPFRIHVRTTDEDSFKFLHTGSFIGIGPVESTVSVQPIRVLEVGCELLALVHWHKVPLSRRWDKCDCSKTHSFTKASGYSLAQSKGFGSETEMIIWPGVQTISPSVERSLCPDYKMFSSLYPIQL